MKFSTRFSLVPNNGNDCPIRMRVSYSGKRIDIRTGLVCPAEKWSEETMRVKPGTKNRYKQTASQINARLSEYELCIERIFSRYELERKIPEPQELKAEFEVAQGKKKQADTKETVEQAYQRFIEETCERKHWTSATIDGYKNVGLRIRDAGLYNLRIDKLKNSDIEVFRKCLLERGLLNSSVSRMSKSFRTFLVWCVSNELLDKSITLKRDTPLKGNKTDKSINYLEWSEVLKLKDVELPKKKLRLVRDIFCFQCFTGLRISDVTAITWQQVELDCDAPFLEFTTRKTADTLRIELNSHAIDILARQKKESPVGAIFDMANTTQFNRQLSVVAETAGLTGTITRTTYSGAERKDETISKVKAITSHWGRHTFIVHALSIGIAPNIIMSWTGHSNYQSMLPYINITGRAKQDSMALFDEGAKSGAK